MHVACACVQGYAPIRLADEDFYDRRVFSRIKAGMASRAGARQQGMAVEQQGSNSSSDSS